MSLLRVILAGMILLGSGICRGMAEAEGWALAEKIVAEIHPPVFPDRDFPITDFGAKGNGDKDCTKAFHDAIDACHAAGGGRVVVPQGTYLTGAIHLKSNVNLYLEQGALISFFTNTEDYLPLVYTRFEGTECMNFSPLIYAFDQENIAITGQGTLDGNGDNTNWWRWKWTARSDIQALGQMGDSGVPVKDRRFGHGYKLRPVMIQPYQCKNILIEGVTIKNSPMWHINPVLSENITVRDVTIVGHGPNNDGCNPECCRNVLIEGCHFDTGDDCIAIKSGRNDDGRRVGVASENIIIRNCMMKDGHGGVVIGSEISGGARNIFAEDCIMDSPNLERGLRIKTNSRRGGVVENIFMRNVVMREVGEAALRINYHYGEGDNGTFPPTVRNVFMTNVRCFKSKYPWLIQGYEHNKISHVVLKGCTFENTQKEGVTEGIEDFQMIPDEAVSIHDHWAEKMAETVMARNADLMSMDFASRLKWSYTYGLVMKALWEVMEKTEDHKIFDYINSYYDRMINEDGTIQTYDMETYNIDMINPGKVLFRLCDETGNKKYKTAIMTLREQMKKHPRSSEGGFWHKKRYAHQMWLDGLYMGSPFLAQYAKHFNEPELFDDVANQIILMEKYTRDPEAGLLYHGWDESREQKWADPETGCSPHFWGRAMGWFAMAIVDVLDEFPANHPKRPELEAILDRLFTALVGVQDPDSGLWYQVLDQSDREGNYLEASASCMYVYSMAKAVRLGYADRKYMAAACKGWDGILTHLTTVDENGWVDIHQCCAVAGLGGNPYRDGSFEYYVGEEIRDNDPKAVGPFILAALELEERN
ncbi:MAG: glycoside hydrolase family 88 protein [Pontiellaceae bacterium]|nr:glycoside hydrolase family 88 protein [Pontiellaceae bacterium]MBN2783470.1 glycoside hydrolase family 88 protein [Pontiellaceae bacterium]